MEDKSTSVNHAHHSFDIVCSPNSAVVIQACRICGLSYVLKADSYSKQVEWVAIPHKDVYGNKPYNKALDECVEVTW